MRRLLALSAALFACTGADEVKVCAYDTVDCTGAETCATQDVPYYESMPQEGTVEHLTITVTCKDDQVTAMSQGIEVALTGGCLDGYTYTCSSDAPCFALDSLAIDEYGDAVPMGSLRSGDLVMDGPASYTRVIVNQHVAVTLQSSLIEISAGAANVSLTPDHVLEVDGMMAAARTVVVGSRLGDLQVWRVTSAAGAVINPLTASGKILSQGGILASTYPEWIAEYMLTSYLFPLPASLCNLLSYLFPETTQRYYDAIIEGFVTRVHPRHLKAALPPRLHPLLLPLAFLLGDLAVAAGFVGFSLASAKGLCTVAAIAYAAAAAAAARTKRRESTC